MDLILQRCKLNYDKKKGPVLGSMGENKVPDL